MHPVLLLSSKSLCRVRDAASGSVFFSREHLKCSRLKKTLPDCVGNWGERWRGIQNVSRRGHILKTGIIVQVNKYLKNFLDTFKQPWGLPPK